MDNHYHLLIETPLANLNQLMQNLNTSYTVYVNRKYQRSGHLFQGRYKAIVVEKDNYLLTLSRYIHLNPVRARVAELPEEYQWSSYKEHIGYVSTGLVDIRDTLSHFSENAKEAMAAYRKFVESGIEEDERPFKDVRAGIVLGREIFFEEKIKDMIRERSVDRELPALRRLLKETPIEQVVRVVADYYKLYPGDLTKRSRRCSRERKIAIYLSKIVTGGKNSTVGTHFGITPQAVTNILIEVESTRAESKEFQKEIDGIKCRL